MSFTRNTEKDFYIEHSYATNCGSLALNIQEWYCPDDSFSEDDWDLAERLIYDLGYSIEQTIRILFQRDVHQLEKDFDMKRVRNRYCSLKEDEDLIAFRIGMNPNIDINDKEDKSIMDVDFHFRVKRDGKWIEKNGCNRVRDIDHYSEKPWSHEEDFAYFGPIAYFVKKRF